MKGKQPMSLDSEHREGSHLLRPFGGTDADTNHCSTVRSKGVSEDRRPY